MSCVCVHVGVQKVEEEQSRAGAGREAWQLADFPIPGARRSGVPGLPGTWGLGRDQAEAWSRPRKELMINWLSPRRPLARPRRREEVGQEAGGGGRGGRAEGGRLPRETASAASGEEPSSDPVSASGGCLGSGRR